MAGNDEQSRKTNMRETREAALTVTEANSPLEVSVTVCPTAVTVLSTLATEQLMSPDVPTSCRTVSSLSAIANFQENEALLGEFITSQVPS